MRRTIRGLPSLLIALVIVVAAAPALAGTFSVTYAITSGYSAETAGVGNAIQNGKRWGRDQ